MEDEKINRLTEDIRLYLENLDKLYKGNFIIEQNNEDIKLTDNAKSDRVSEEPAGYLQSTLKKQREINEVDLFGNITVTKESWELSESLGEMNSIICCCQKCRLASTRTNFVFGVGNPKAHIVLVGEAPGADEDAKGEPFVGRAGQLLNKIIESINLKREEVYICNILKCRPPGNRNPLPDEIELCEPYLKKQLELIKPKLILALGKFAAETLLRKREPLGKMRGKIHSYNGIQTMVTFHPAALLRNPNWKKDTWEDVKQFRKLYDDILANSN